MIRGMAVSKLPALLVVGALLTAAGGCGGDPTPDAPKPKPQPATIDLEPFLLRDGEEPGFVRVASARTDTNFEAFAQSLNLSPATTRRLRRDGFVSVMFQPVDGEDGNGGVTSVNLFQTAEGARDWTDYETSEKGIHTLIPDTKIKRFTVPGIPGARGWTGLDIHGNRIGHVYWVQGRCMLLIGNEGNGTFVAPLSTAARAIYARTKGVCP
jgi:hypothetical protein